MKILFSPSETKNSGGVEKIFDENSFIFPAVKRLASPCASLTRWVA